MQVAACWQYPEALAAIQAWEQYLSSGGTVEARWAQHTRRAREIAALEDAYQQ